MVFYFYFITLSSAAVIFYCSNNVSFLLLTLFRLHKIKMIIVVFSLSSESLLLLGWVTILTYCVLSVHISELSMVLKSGERFFLDIEIHFRPLKD